MILVATRREHVDGLVEIKRRRSEEVGLHEVMDFFFRLAMEVLEFVQRCEFLDAQSVGQNFFGATLEQVVGFDGRDVGDGGEHVGAMGGCPLDAISVIDLTIAGFLIGIDPGEAFVEILR